MANPHLNNLTLELIGPLEPARVSEMNLALAQTPHGFHACPQIVHCCPPIRSSTVYLTFPVTVRSRATWSRVWLAGGWDSGSGVAGRAGGWDSGSGVAGRPGGAGRLPVGAGQGLPGRGTPHPLHPWVPHPSTPGYTTLPPLPPVHPARQC